MILEFFAILSFIGLLLLILGIWNYSAGKINFYYLLIGSTILIVVGLFAGSQGIQIYSGLNTTTTEFDNSTTWSDLCFLTQHESHATHYPFWSTYYNATHNTGTYIDLDDYNGVYEQDTENASVSMAVHVNFTSIDSFGGTLGFKGRYQGTVGQTMRVDIYDWVNDTWLNLGTLQQSTTDYTKTFAMPTQFYYYSESIPLSNVTIRFYHPVAASTHVFYGDVVYLLHDEASVVEEPAWINCTLNTNNHTVYEAQQVAYHNFAGHYATAIGCLMALIGISGYIASTIDFANSRKKEE